MSERGLYYGSSYDRYNESNEGSTTQKLKQAYWTTKQVVIKKFGRKEDEFVVASDCELDAKLELFYSVQKTSMDLMRIIERYQEKICMLSQAENELGRFLKNQGSEDKTRAGKMMTAVGKSLSFSAQQRLALRVPLARLQQEVETFRYRAISDTLQTVTAMEQRRTDYRAALLWMRDVSENLDPDTFKQLDKFRKVQALVRKNKTKFDKFKLDSMQKVDLLAASRCNMFSHVLSLYQTTLLQFWEKTCRTMVAVADSFKGYQYYEFSMLKDLTDESRKLAELTRKKCNTTEENKSQKVLDESENKSEEIDDFDALNKHLDEIFTGEYKEDPENEIRAAIESNKLASSALPGKKEIQDKNISSEQEAEESFLKMTQETLKELPDYYLPIDTTAATTDLMKSNNTGNADLFNLGLIDQEDQENDKAFLEDIFKSVDNRQKSIFDDFIGQTHDSTDSRPDWSNLFGGSDPIINSNDSNLTTVPAETTASQMLSKIMPSALLDHRSQLTGLDPFSSLIASGNLSGDGLSQGSLPSTGNTKGSLNNKSSTSAWISMFADLDPLANPDILCKKEGQITDT